MIFSFFVHKVLYYRRVWMHVKHLPSVKVLTQANALNLHMHPPIWCSTQDSSQQPHILKLSPPHWQIHLPSFYKTTVARIMVLQSNPSLALWERMNPSNTPHTAPRHVIVFTIREQRKRQTWKACVGLAGLARGPFSWQTVPWRRSRMPRAPCQQSQTQSGRRGRGKGPHWTRPGCRVWASDMTSASWERLQDSTWTGAESTQHCFHWPRALNSEISKCQTWFPSNPSPNTQAGIEVWVNRGMGH